MKYLLRAIKIAAATITPTAWSSTTEWLMRRSCMGYLWIHALDRLSPAGMDGEEPIGPNYRKDFHHERPEGSHQQIPLLFLSLFQRCLQIRKK
jgi:hypothetical protein